MEKVYLIKTGSSSFDRKIVIVTPDTCFVVQRHEKNEVAIWGDGITDTEGKELVDAYKNKGPAAYGRAWNKILSENINKGWSDRGLFPKEEFIRLLTEEYALTNQTVVEVIYNAIWEKKSELTMLEV